MLNQQSLFLIKKALNSHQTCDRAGQGKEGGGVFGDETMLSLPHQLAPMFPHAAGLNEAN